MSNLKKIALLGVLLTGLSVPTQKAEAGLVLVISGQPAWAILPMTGSVLSFIYTDSIVQKEDKDTKKSFKEWSDERQTWFIVGLVLFAVDKMESEIETKLAKEFPYVPKHALAQAATEFAKVAKKTKANKSGVVSVSLKDAVARKILKSMAYVDADIKARFHKVMTHQLDI